MGIVNYRLIFGDFSYSSRRYFAVGDAEVEAGRELEYGGDGSEQDRKIVNGFYRKRSAGL